MIAANDPRTSAIKSRISGLLFVGSTNWRASINSPQKLPNRNTIKRFGGPFFLLARKNPYRNVQIKNIKKCPSLSYSQILIDKDFSEGYSVAKSIERVAMTNSAA